MVISCFSKQTIQNPVATMGEEGVPAHIWTGQDRTRQEQKRREERRGEERRGEKRREEKRREDRRREGKRREEKRVYLTFHFC